MNQAQPFRCPLFHKDLARHFLHWVWIIQMKKGDQGHLRSELVQYDLEAWCLPEASLQKAKPQRIKGLHMGIK